MWKWIPSCLRWFARSLHEVTAGVALPAALVEAFSVTGDRAKLVKTYREDSFSLRLDFALWVWWRNWWWCGCGGGTGGGVGVPTTFETVRLLVVSSK